MEDLILDHPFISIPLFFIIIFTISSIPVYFLMKTKCVERTKLMNIESNFGFYTGCMVKIDNRWQPFNEYITVNN